MDMKVQEHPLQLDTCFIHKGHLVPHQYQNTHTGDKPYQCSHCGKAFSQRAILARHLKMHTGEKPYQCSQCDKTFIQNNNLISYMKTHTGEKLYQFNHCDVPFTVNSNVIINGKTHKSEKIFQYSSNALESTCVLQFTWGHERGLHGSYHRVIIYTHSCVPATYTHNWLQPTLPPFGFSN